METLQDTYNSTSEASTPSQPTLPTPSDPNPDSEPEIGIIKNESSFTPLTEDSPNLPLITDADEDLDEDDDEELDVDEDEQLLESSPKKPKTLKLESMGEITQTPSPSSIITPVSLNGKPSATSKSSKKYKKKSKDVWAPTSRKGKKKTKHASNNNNNADIANGDVIKDDDKAFITPIPRFPDRNDDSPDAKICLSKVYKAEKVELSEDRLSAGSSKGYRMVRATRGVSEGAWYFEIKVVCLGETGHTRLGWSTEKGDLQAPVGYDGNSFGYRDVDGSKVHKALREKYGEEGYGEGDVIGFYISLPDGSVYAPSVAPLVWYKGQRYTSVPGAKEEPPKVVPGSEISYYKNGICQGVAFRDLYGGCYYPAASMFTLPNQPNCAVKFNFGPDFEKFPEDFGERPVPRAMIEVPYQSHDVRVENGTPWNMNRMCPTMFKVVNDE